MGNQQSSRSQTPTSSSNPQSPNVTSSHAAAHHSHDRSSVSAYAYAYAHAYHGPNPRRRESIQALSTAKASAAPPSASLESAAASSPRSHARARSQTIAASTTAAVANTLRAAQDHFKSTSDDRMGNEQSRPKGHGHAHSQSQQTRPSALTPPKPKPSEQPKGRPLPSPSPQTRPVDVPAAPREDADVSRTEAASSIEPADASLNEPIVPSSHYSRPPRLPLPIEQEPFLPGSPIISAADGGSTIIDHGDVEAALPRRLSMLSTTTADEDDLDDEYKESQGEDAVPTLVEWEGPGERVYVTGTFAGWNRKFRLNRNGPSKKKDALSAYVHISPGTHHLMFIVDNDMRTSDKLPTAVDYTNILVNYIEVLKPSPEVKAQPELAEKKTEPIPVLEQRPPDGYRPPQVLPTTPEIKPIKKPVPEPKAKIPPPSPKKYHNEIPRYLLDLDEPEESRRYARATAVCHMMPNAPSLPLFLNKSILNGVTPMKDDSSVLIMPNHTVLNHLATSSIKDNILATSATTRYKQKFLTTIMYKPRSEEPEQA
ncbi:AMPKBI-domain-containing protein [Byssothecium circinans]|uniref:AMPKBI-domain-containing protein n=1 Tax=Byssothecium circinans TaxID=147558 RepID=A0A6A5TXN3_9PLEO|nr:AMPKBI-domain-containing protein [Byssothecium circinans]